MEKVVAKFQVQGITPSNPDKPEDGSSITLTPVVGGSAENDHFYKWTPGGQIVLSTVNQNAAEYFTVGKPYYVEFIAAAE